MTVAGARLETPGIFLSYMKVSDNLRKIYTRGHGAHLTLSDPSFRDADTLAEEEGNLEVVARGGVNREDHDVRSRFLHDLLRGVAVRIPSASRDERKSVCRPVQRCSAVR